MKRIASTVALAAVLAAASSGCYGTTRSTKRTAHVANAVIGGLGLLIAASAGGDSCPENADVSCGVGQGMAAAGAVMLAAPLLIGAAIGEIRNIGTPLQPEPGEVLPTGPVYASGAPGMVTAPGLRPATIAVE